MLRPIHKPTPGDKLLCAEWKPDGQRPSFEPVTETIASERWQTLVHLRLDNGETLTCTAGHPLMMAEGWRDAALVKRGGKLLLSGGETAPVLKPQRSARRPSPRC